MCDLSRKIKAGGRTLRQKSTGFIAGIASVSVVAAFGRKLHRREGDPAEHFAGILTAAGIVAAFLGGNGVIQHRNDQLGFPLQTDQ